MVSFALLALAAAAAQPDPASSSYERAADHRVATIGYRLATLGRSYCPRVGALSGLSLHHLAEYEDGDRIGAARQFALDRGPVVLSVVAGSPAAEARLARGDILVSIGGVAIPDGSSAAAPASGREARRAIEVVETWIDSALAAGPSEIEVIRAHHRIVVPIVPIRGCAAKVRLARSSQMNAFANRGYAIVTTALLDFARNDDEVALILGHEMAHVVLAHRETLDAQGTPTGLLRHFGVNASRIRTTEAEADRLGLRLARAAGFDIAAAKPFWRRYMGRLGPRIVTTHPGLAAREQIVDEVLAEPPLQPGPQAPQLGESALPQR